MRKYILLLCFIVLAFWLSGCFAPRNCNTLPPGVPSRTISDEEKMLCYHENAIKKAYSTDLTEALLDCERIKSFASDYAEMQYDRCIADVARISKNVTVCERIPKKPDWFGLGSGDSNEDKRKLCVQEATPLPPWQWSIK